MTQLISTRKGIILNLNSISKRKQQQLLHLLYRILNNNLSVFYYSKTKKKQKKKNSNIKGWIIIFSFKFFQVLLSINLQGQNEDLFLAHQPMYINKKQKKNLVNLDIKITIFNHNNQSFNIVVECWFIFSFSLLSLVHGR